MGGWILRVEFHLPHDGQFNVRLLQNLCVGQPGNECPIVQTQVSESARFVRASRCPKCETEGEMISLAKVMACYNGSKDHIEQYEGAVSFSDTERAEGDVCRALKPRDRKGDSRVNVQ